MIVELNGRPLSEARAAAANFLQATRPDGALPPVGHRTSDEERLESARMRDKTKGTVKMRAEILDALERLQHPVLRAAKIREDDSQDDDADGLADAAGAAADGWPDDLLSDAIDGITTGLFDAAGKGAAAEVKTSWNVVPKNAIAAIKKAHLEFSKAFIERERTALKAMLTNAVESGMSVGELRDEIANFFEDGIHYVDDAGKVTRVLPADSWAEMVARTEVSRAYNAGHMATYQAAGIQRVRWLTASDERTCEEICAPLERVTVAVGDTFPGTDVTEPPAHPNCAPAGTRVLSLRGAVPIEDIRVGDQVLTHRNRFRIVRALSRLDLSAELVELRVGPHVLRVTEEHPILTSKGWTAAASLKPGDEIYSVKAETVLGASGETDQLPSLTLQERFLRRVIEALPFTSMPSAAVDLDRELPLREGDVDSELVERKVRFARKARGAKRVDDDLLVAGVAFTGSRDRKLSIRLRGSLRTAYGIMRSLGERVSLVRRHLGVPNEHRGAATANGKIKAHEASGDSGACDAGALRQREYRFSRQVPHVQGAQLVISEGALRDARAAQSGDLPHSSLCHTAIVPLSSATRVAFTGTVYNFAVDEDESYIAEGIVSHNCRCTTVAVWETDRNGDDDDSDDDDEGDE